MADKAEILEAFENLTPEDYDECRADFDAMDADKSGSLSFDEVNAAIQKDGGVSDEDATKLMKQYDLDGDGTVTIKEYLQCMGYKLK